jgi:thiosulfate dehydrogenase [quinone] large subunit
MKFSGLQLAGLVTLRVVIGWHLLYEGFVKLANPYWTSAAYLRDSQWIFSGLFHWMAENPQLVNIVDLMNIWGLILIGMGLIAGFMNRTVCIAGMGFLFLYYISNPPLVGLTSTVPAEGSYLLVNKNLIEMAALFVLFHFPTGYLIGVDRLFASLKKGGFDERGK